MPAAHFIVAAVCLSALALPAAFARAAGTAKDAVPKHPEMVAHRGESHDAPENTLAAINLAWKRGVEAVEMDLHLSSDGKLVMIHDKDTFRTTGGENGGKKLVVLETPAAELAKLDVGAWKGLEFAGERIVTIDEVLATLPPDTGKRLFIEVKVGPDAAAPLVAAIKKAGRPPEQTAVISFNLKTCQAVKEMAPQLKVFYLSDFKVDKKTGTPPPTIDELIATAKAAKLDGLDLSKQAPLDPAAVKRIRDAGLELYVWTIDDPAVAKRFIDLGVDGVTTNRAEWLGQELDLPPFGPARKAETTSAGQ